MRHVLLFIITFIAMAFHAIVPAHAQQERTIKSEMRVIHESFDVNFVYDSSIDLDIPYSGKPMKGIKTLEECLTTLFAGTGIEYEITKKYIVLTKVDKKKKPRDYTILIEEQHDTINESIITAQIGSPVNSTQTGLERIEGSRFNQGFAFLSSPDIIKTILTLPGVSYTGNCTGIGKNPCNIL